MKVSIIGAGWYGCHIASILKERGIDVDVYEKEGEIFQKASSKNQNRLHLGFHYPRSFITREQSKEGYKRFIKKYDNLCKKVNKNIYSVDNHKSVIDFETYVSIMKSAELSFNIVDYPSKMFKNLDGFIETEEMVVDFNLAKAWFEKVLKDDIIVNTEIKSEDIIECKEFISLQEKKYDYMINCTWGVFRPFDNIDIFYELCVTLLYRSLSNKEFALTIMDGEFVSLYPYSQNLYTLTSVKHTPLKKYKSMNDVKKNLTGIAEDEVSKVRNEIEKETLYYYPQFLENFSYHGYYTSIKTKLNVKNDCRQVIVESRGREIFVLPGKIDTIFYAEDRILSILGLQ
jgi:hypothetical protein